MVRAPFFDPKADAAFNYGAIGVVIGHEMTHGFDDQGRQYDANPPFCVVFGVDFGAFVPLCAR